MTATATRPSAAAPRPQPAPAARARSRWLVVLAVAGGLYIALYLVVAALRWRYPYELEWMEGGMVGQVARLRAGQPLYGPPSLLFTPYLYTPFYDVVAGAASLVGGLGFPALRAVSIVASLGLLVAVGRLAADDADGADGRWTGLLAAGTLAATYRVGGAWLDLAREDSLALCLLFAGLVLARRARTPARAAAAGLVLALAVLSKQVALLPALAVVPFLLVARRGRAATLAYIGTMLGVVVAVTTALQAATGGWYLYYTLAVPGRHELVASQWVGFFTHDLLRPLPVVVSVSVAALAWLWRDRRRDALCFHLLVGGAIVAAAYSARLHSGGYDNVVLPAYAEVAVLFAIGAERLLGPRRPARRGLATAVGVACLLQLVALRYDPGAQVPDRAREAGGDAAVAALARLPQPVYLPGHPWYLSLAGQAPGAQSAAIEDVLRAGGSEADALARQLHDAIAQQRFGAIVVDSGTGYSYLPPDTCRWYEPAGALAPGAPLALPVTGTMTAPDTVLVRRAVPLPAC